MTEAGNPSNQPYETEAAIRTYRCPGCGSDSLEVVVEVWATLTQSEGNFETDTSTPDNANHEWTRNSLMRCVDCGRDGIAEAFEAPEAE